MSDSAFLIQIDHAKILQALRSISNSTNERTIIVSHISESAVGHSASVIDYECAQTVAYVLVLANMNSLPLDWAARLSMGGTNLSYFIMKQLPILNPEIFLYKSLCGKRYFELIVLRVLELTYTADDMQGFAKDLGYNGPPFAWDDNRRHCLKCELDAIFAHMYQLERTDLEWILDASLPEASFPTLKNNEMKQFGEYRTKRYVLHAYDQLKRGDIPSTRSCAFC